MTDPFEVRMRFTSQLQHLNASVASAQKAAQYALKYRDMCEDLHSCILEQLERNNMNTRANIMYFIEHFLDMAQSSGNGDYVRMIQRDIIRVVDAVAPDDGSGAANVKVVRRVLQALQQKSFLSEQTVKDIEEVLKERETIADDVGLVSPAFEDAKQSQVTAKSGGRQAPAQRLDKRQIEQRIEEDRERHKRQRESIWAVPSGPNAERTKIEDETSDYGDDDRALAEEELEEMQRGMRQICRHSSAEKNSTLVHGDRKTAGKH